MPRNNNTEVEQWSDTEDVELEDSEFNWSEVPEFDPNAQFEVQPRGDYNFEITNTEFSYAQSSGNPMLTWEYTFTNPTTGKTFKVWDNGTFHEEQRPRFWHRCKQLKPDLPANWNPKTQYTVFNGVRGRAKVGIQKASGVYKERNKVIDILPYSPGSMLTTDDL